MEALFTEIYHRNTFGGIESRSGHGSSLQNTETIRAALPGLLLELDIHTLLDIPCGDFFWMKEIDLGQVFYIGADIVAPLIEANDQAWGSGARRFYRLDITRDDLPCADLILCRDLLVHFSNKDALRAIGNIKASGSKYLLTTTFTGRQKNEDIITGEWRPINLQLPPFNFPQPLKVICENYHGHGGVYADMSQALWSLDHLRFSQENQLVVEG